MQNISETPNQILTYNKQTQQKLQILQGNIYRHLGQFQKYQNVVSNKKKQTETNTQKIHNNLLLFLSQSFKPLALVLIFIDDKDLLALGSICKLAYKLLYSPLGFRLTMNLRPLVYKIRGKQKSIQFSQIALKNLSEDRSLQGLQEEDKVAIMMMMKTNLMATKQKINELDKCNQKYQKQNQKLISQLTQINIKREDYEKRISSYKTQIQRYVETIHQNCDYIKKMKDQQQQVIFEKQNKLTVIQTDQSKLKRQKQLLIKKIKCMEEEKKNKEVYTHESQKIFNLMRKITNIKTTKK